MNSTGGRQVREDSRTPNLTLAMVAGEAGAEARQELVASIHELLKEATLLRAMLLENRPGAFMADTAEGLATRAGFIGESVRAMVEEETEEERKDDQENEHQHEGQGTQEVGSA